MPHTLELPSSLPPLGYGECGGRPGSPQRGDLRAGERISGSPRSLRVHACVSVCVRVTVCTFVIDSAGDETTGPGSEGRTRSRVLQTFALNARRCVIGGMAGDTGGSETFEVFIKDEGYGCPQLHSWVL